MSRVCFGPATYDSSCRTSIFLSISVWSSYFVYACLNLVLGGEVSWNDLVQNPAKWWDNRLDKRNEKAPDFKHKDTGEGLWLDSSPSWVLAKLPPVKPKQIVETDRKSTLVS